MSDVFCIVRRSTNIYMIGMLCLACHSFVNAEDSIDIALGQSSLKDPLIEYVMPPNGSPDRVRFLANGILVCQVPEVKGKPTGGTGIKLHANFRDDFKFRVEFECRKLQKPSSGWGQGMMIRLLTDNPSSPVMAFGCIATKSLDRCYYIQFPHKGGKPIRFVRSSEFRQGAWIIERQASEISLTIEDEKGNSTEIASMPCTTASLNGIQLWCTRQVAGNSDAEFLLERIQLSGTHFFTQEEHNAGWWRWWSPLLCVCSLNAIGFVAYRSFSRSRA